MTARHRPAMCRTRANGILPEEVSWIVENAGGAAVGIAALLLILAAVGTAVLEVRITVTQVRSQNRYRKADERKNRIFSA